MKIKYGAKGRKERERRKKETRVFPFFNLLLVADAAAAT